MWSDDLLLVGRLANLGLVVTSWFDRYPKNESNWALVNNLTHDQAQ